MQHALSGPSQTGLILSHPGWPILGARGSDILRLKLRIQFRCSLVGRCIKTSYSTCVSFIQPNFLVDSVFSKTCWLPAFGRRLQTIWLRVAYKNTQKSLVLFWIRKRINNKEKRHRNCCSSRWTLDTLVFTVFFLVTTFFSIRTSFTAHKANLNAINNKYWDSGVTEFICLLFFGILDSCVRNSDSES